MEEALETIQKGLGVTVTNTSDDPVICFENLRFDTCGVYPNLSEIMDGCGDTSVTLLWVLSACGCHDEYIHAEVDRANLDKFGPGGHKDPITGKWIKPPDHKSADMKLCVRQQLEEGEDNEQEILEKIVWEHVDYNEDSALAVMQAVENVIAKEHEKWIKSSSV